MHTGSLGLISNRQDWFVSSPLIDDDGQEIDLTTAEIEVYVCPHDCPHRAVLSGSVADGTVTLPTNTSFQWHFTADQMTDLCEGPYEVFVRVTIDDITSQILARCSIDIIEGGPR